MRVSGTLMQQDAEIQYFRFSHIHVHAVSNQNKPLILTLYGLVENIYKY
jgi:hypothetical protein